jgi:enoyl-CoA hydratase/carnithine racemase
MANKVGFNMQRLGSKQRASCNPSKINALCQMASPAAGNRGDLTSQPRACSNSRVLETLRYEQQDGVAVLTLHRPERLNAINSAMARELPAVWRAIKEDPAVQVVIVTGAGERALSTGFDVGDVALGQAEVGELAFTGLQNRCWKPVITAVNGMVCGGGLHFVADSDLVVAAEHAAFFDSHVNVGLVAAMEPIVLGRRMALERVMRLSLVGRGERMSARRALDLGLCGDVVPGAQLLPRALELARTMMAGSPAALAATKRALWESLNLGLQDARELGWRAIEGHWNHPDVAEGARAFAEKRKPRWAPPQG